MFGRSGDLKMVRNISVKKNGLNRAHAYPHTKNPDIKSASVHHLFHIHYLSTNAVFRGFFVFLKVIVLTIYERRKSGQIKLFSG